MITYAQHTYTPKTWDLSGLQGISDNTLFMHFGLYEGYVKNTNLLNEQLAEILKNGQAAATNLAYAEMTRRLGFEYNGMRLHEYYFDNLTNQGGGEVPSAIKDALAATFGDFETWKKDFVAKGTMRGVGWAIAYQDPSTGGIQNHWVTLHEEGNIAGFRPILVMDVWEHAYLLDYKTERPRYIEAFFSNINWSTVAARVLKAD